MATGKYIVQFESTHAVGNPAQVGFYSQNSAINATHCAALLLGYIKTIRSVFAEGTSVGQILFYPETPGPGTALPFPVTAYAELQDIYTELPDWTEFGLVGGTGALCPIGTSLSVSEMSDLPGRPGRGRHFLPFIGASIVATNGDVGQSALDGIKVAYDSFILDPALPSPFLGGFEPCITNAAVTSANVITHVKPQPILSNLRSRRR